MDNATKAYIAGFLDGDGSIMLQIKPRKDCRYKHRITSTICMYQNSSQEKNLRSIRDQLKLGYISRRNDRMSEYRIDGHMSVAKVLKILKPYILFKKEQIKYMLQAVSLLQKRNLTPSDFLKACKLADKVASFNYSVSRKHTFETVRKSFLKQKLLSP